MFCLYWSAVSEVYSEQRLNFKCRLLKPRTTEVLLVYSTGSKTGLQYFSTVVWCCCWSPSFIIWLLILNAISYFCSVYFWFADMYLELSVCWHLFNKCLEKSCDRASLAHSDLIYSFISAGRISSSSRLKAEQRGGRTLCCLSHSALIKINCVPVKSPPAVFSPDSAG